MELLGSILTVVLIDNKINWLEVFVTGFFTLFGAGFGALIAGKFAVDSVERQLNDERKSRQDEKKSKQIKILEESLVLTSLFITKYEYAISWVEEFKDQLDSKSANNVKLSSELIKKGELAEISISRASDENKKIDLKLIPYKHSEAFVQSQELIVSVKIFITAFNVIVKSDDGDFLKKITEFKSLEQFKTFDSIVITLKDNKEKLREYVRDSKNKLELLKED